MKPHFARPLIPHINTKPNVGSDFVDRKKSETNILFVAECEIYKVLQIWSEINIVFQFKNFGSPPLVIE